MSRIARLLLQYLTHRVSAMVFVDNKVALRQLEIANAALLSRPSLKSGAQLAAGQKSIAKDGKFHPRVLTLVSINLVYVRNLGEHVLCRAVITPSHSHCFVASPGSTDLSGEHHLSSPHMATQILCSVIHFDSHLGRHSSCLNKVSRADE